MTAYSIGIDLGGTNLRVASYRPGSGLGERLALPTRVRKGGAAVVVDIAAAVRHIVDGERGAEPAGICMAAPGPLELPRGRMHQPPNLPGWDGFELRRALEQELGREVMAENDANAAALAECHLGRGRELRLDSLCMLTLGTGVGGALIEQGRVFHGAHGLAGEFGHVAVWPEGPRCSCGNRGCLEMYASATAIRRQALALAAQGEAAAIGALGEGVTAADVARLAGDGDAPSLAVFAQVGTALGIAIAVLINSLDPALVVLAGGVARAWPLFAPALLAELRERSYLYRLTSEEARFPAASRVLPALLGDDAGLIGAALYPFVQSRPPAR
jgi:glucokinase